MNTIEIAKSEGVFVRCNSAGVFNCAKDWDWRVSCMSDYDIWLVCGGFGRLKSCGKSYDISAGDCFFIAPKTSLYAHHDPENPLSVVGSHLDFITPDGTKAICKDAPPFHIRLPDFFFVERLLRRCVESFLVGRKQQANIWLQSAVLELKNATSAFSKPSDGIYTAKINEICAMIAAAPEKEYSIKDLAAKLHVCSDHFTRIFKETMHISPIDFIVNCRIETAKNLLISSSQPINIIAEMAGYKSAYYFSKHFKAKTGSTPSRFRKIKAG